MVLMTLSDIFSRCPIDPQRVSVVENGLSLRARFSALVFPLQGTDIFLHCRVSLCDSRSYSCAPVSQTFILLIIKKKKQSLANTY